MRPPPSYQTHPIPDGMGFACSSMNTTLSLFKFIKFFARELSCRNEA